MHRAVFRALRRVTWPHASRVRLPAPRRQSEVGGDVARPAEARRIVDRRHERERCHRTNAGDAMKRRHGSLRATILTRRSCSRPTAPSAPDTIASISSAEADRPPQPVATPVQRPRVRPCPVGRMPNDFSERRMAFSGSRNLVFRLRRCVSRSRFEGSRRDCG